MESEAAPKVEANFRPPEMRGDFNVEAPSEVMKVDSPEFQEYKSGVEAQDTARLAEVRTNIEEFKTDYKAPYKSTLENYEIVERNGEKYIIEYVPQEVLGSGVNGMAYGLGTGDYAQVSEDLPPRIRNFVKAHELYHLQDYKPGGTLRREIRASFYPMLKDRKGAWETIKDTFKRKERRDFYLNRIKNWLLHSAR